PEIELECHAFLDSGSQRSYSLTSVTEALRLPKGTPTHLSVRGLGGVPTSFESHTVEIGIRLLDGSSMVFSANTMPKITHKGILTASLPNAEVDIVQPSVLLGNNIFWEICASNITSSLPNGFKVVRSKVGDIVTGRGLIDLSKNYPVHLETTAMVATECYEHLWKLETIGIMDDPHVKDDEVAEELFKRQITWTGNHYEVPLLWNSDSPQLPTNVAVCRKRLVALYNRLKRNPENLSGYDGIIKEQLRQGIIEEAPPDNGSLCHHLPHRDVFKEDKRRIVFDASSKERKNDNSLNDCQYRGPSRLPDISAVMLRARIPPICVWSDLEKAFLKLGLAEKDRNVTRFLWLRDISKPPSLDNIITYRFCRVLFGMKCSPSLLRMTIEHHLQRDGSQVALDILRNAYVDDICQPVLNVGEGIERYNQAKALFAAAGMNLRDFKSNSSELNAYFVDQGEKAVPEIVKVLGTQWNTIQD
uniref:DUF1758 domain-containing protein n=1 Tax=Steinernema glaseri TaxID=37863 RepID=A0A1I7YR93_9BILA